MNVLKEVDKMLCIFHKWNKWSKRRRATITIVNNYYSTKRVEGRYIQDRTCDKCGKYQWRLVNYE